METDLAARIKAALTKKPRSSALKISRMLRKDFEPQDTIRKCEEMVSQGLLLEWGDDKLVLPSDKSRNILNDRRHKEYHTDDHHRTLRRTRMQVIRKLNKGKPINDKQLAKILGCSTKEFAKHLEENFQPGMDWDNHGVGRDKWHIDHTIPCAHFDLTDPEQLKQCFNYKNQLPMWSTENTTKGAVTRKKNK